MRGITYLPKLEILKKQIETDPDIIIHYDTCEYFNGDPESIVFIFKKIWEYRLKNMGSDYNICELYK